MTDAAPDAPTFKLQLDRDGNPDFKEMRESLADSLKTSIFAALPDEYFDKQVQVVFGAMTRPRANVPTKGDERCKSCKGDRYNKGRAACPHNTGPGPSEIDEMIYAALRERFKGIVESIASRWADKNFDDQAILDRVDALVEKSAQAFLSSMGDAIVKHVLDQMSVSVSNLEAVVTPLLSKSCTGCSRPVLSGNQCLHCGTYC